MTMTIQELLNERELEYKSFTKKLLELCEEKVIKALRYYTKSDRNISIKSIDFYPKNKKIVVFQVISEFVIGDKIIASDGKQYVIDEDNIKKFTSEIINIVVPIDILDNGSHLEIYEKLKSFDYFIRKFGVEKFNSCLDAGITDFDELVNDANEEILDKITDPIEAIVEKLNDVQKLEYMLYSKNSKSIN